MKIHLWSKYTWIFARYGNEVNSNEVNSNEAGEGFGIKSAPVLFKTGKVGYHKRKSNCSPWAEFFAWEVVINI